MSSRKLPATDPHSIFSDLDSIARQSGLILRHSRKFSASGFLLSLLQSVTRGSCSLNQIAMALGQFESDSMSRQALHKRFNEYSSTFLMRVISALLASKAQPLFASLKSGLFRRVLVEDSTVISMAASNAEHFPNNGNGRGMTAGCKVNLLTDLLSGTTIASDLHMARDPDQALTNEVLRHCKKGDLILRDMGFFCINTLTAIEQRKAFWISRLPANTSLENLDGIRLEKILLNSRSNQLDIEVTIGTRRPKRCRLVATRLSAKQAEKNRRHRRREAKSHGAVPSKSGLLRDGWSLVITNLDSDQVDADKLYQIYSFRWSIEIQFRAFKQACRLHLSLNHKSDPFHIEALVLAAMIFQLLTLDLHAKLRGQALREVYNSKRTQIIAAKDRIPSIEKVADAYAAYLQMIASTQSIPSFKADPRHLNHDRRQRVTLWAAMVHCLG